MSHRVAVLGAGSFGTAIAVHLAKRFPTLLWARSSGAAEQLQHDRCNQRYLPDTLFPDGLSITAALAETQEADSIIIAVPSHAFAEMVHQLTSSQLKKVTWLTKGIEPACLKLLHQVVIDRQPDAQFAVLSGPSFAKEVAQGLPTAVTLASPFTDYQQEMHGLLHADQFRVYLSKDHIGVQLAGAIKNVIAIAVGVSDGLGFGANARAALITRGLNEMRALGLVYQADPHTFTGLSGIGDLLLTATDNQSRNRRFGLALGKGQSVPQALTSIQQVVEGKDNAQQIVTMAGQHQLALPICQVVSQLIEQQITATQGVDYLLKRPATHE